MDWTRIEPKPSRFEISKYPNRDCTADVSEGSISISGGFPLLFWPYGGVHCLEGRLPAFHLSSAWIGSFPSRLLPGGLSNKLHWLFWLHLHHSNTRVRKRHSFPYCCWSLWWISADGTFSPTRNLITMRCSTLHSTFCSLITLATPRHDWTGSNLSRREGGGCGFTLSRLHSCCTVRLVYTQISPRHIWTTLYILITVMMEIVSDVLYHAAI